MDKQELEKKVSEHEERLLSIVSGNIGLMNTISRLEIELDKLKLDTEQVLDILRQRDDELRNEISKLKGYYISIQQDMTTIVKAVKKLNNITKN